MGGTLLAVDADEMLTKLRKIEINVLIAGETLQMAAKRRYYSMSLTLFVLTLLHSLCSLTLTISHTVFRKRKRRPSGCISHPSSKQNRGSKAGARAWRHVLSLFN